MKKKSIITSRIASAGSNLTRRNFLKMGSIAVTGLSLSRNRLLAADTVDRKIHIGVVGGNFGSHFYWHEHPNCIVEAVSDLRPARRDHLMKTYQCNKSYNSLEELVKDKKVDAVAVFTRMADNPIGVPRENILHKILGSEGTPAENIQRKK